MPFDTKQDTVQERSLISSELLYEDTTLGRCGHKLQKILIQDLKGTNTVTLT